jgi:predicted phosphoribosyltransferase
MVLPFRDRAEAGRQLAQRLTRYRHTDAVVLALPRGGVPVGFEIAKALDLPLDVFVVRKLGVPGSEELAMGAIGSGGVRVLNQDVVESLRITPGTIEEVAAREQQELERRERNYREGRPPVETRGRTVILVDDGVATGASMLVAARAIRMHQPAETVIAIPVGPVDTCADFAGEADHVVCLATPSPFHAVGLWYMDFSQTTDEMVRELLRQAVRPSVIS